MINNDKLIRRKRNEAFSRYLNNEIEKEIDKGFENKEISFYDKKWCEHRDIKISDLHFYKNDPLSIYYQDRYKMTENHQLENLRDQLKQLEREKELADKNERMFYRLWSKWIKEKGDLKSAILRIERQIDEIEETTP